MTSHYSLARERCPRLVGHDDQSIERRLEGSTCTLAAARPLPETVRVSVGRWRAFRCAIGSTSQCVLVVMGATAEGKKELVALSDGYRESEESWRELLLDLKTRGMAVEPALAIGDGALGFWKVLPQVFGTMSTIT